MRQTTIAIVLLIFAKITAFPAIAQPFPEADPLQYADLADLSVNAPLIVHATVKKAIKVDAERAVNAPPGTQRFYVEAETNALIRGQGGIQAAIRYIVDMPLDQRGRAPKIKKRQYIIFAQRSARGNGEVQLVAKDAQLAWSPARESRVRAIVREIVARDAPPAISRIASAFHVPGTIIGEGETQVFLETATGTPISITVLSRQGQRKVWAVSLGEIVDEAAKAPPRNSLLWYRLACFLPRQLPPNVLTDAEYANALEARRDYQLVLTSLGNCPRTRQL